MDECESGMVYDNCGLVMLLGGGALLLFKTVSPWCVLILFGGIAFGLLGIITLRRTRQPPLVLMQDAIASPWLPQPLPLKILPTIT